MCSGLQGPSDINMVKLFLFTTSRLTLGETGDWMVGVIMTNRFTGGWWAGVVGHTVYLPGHYHVWNIGHNHTF